MSKALMAWLDEPIIPRKYVIIGGMAVYVGLFEFLKAADAVNTELEETITIVSEATHFLLDRADDATVLELNERLDFWRVLGKLDTSLDTDR